MGVTAASPRLLLAGATGLIGGEVLRGLLVDRAFHGRVLAPVRRPLPQKDPRLASVPSELNDPERDDALRQALADQSGTGLDAYVCCLGTTIKTAGSREAFIAVDRELVLRLAKIARTLGARQAILVSSVGASRQSGNFYLRVKGEAEDGLKAIGFERIDILRPGLLLGARNERRPGEAIAQALAPAYNPLLRGKLRRYRAIDAAAVAQAIRVLLDRNEPGVFVHEHDALIELTAAEA